MKAKNQAVITTFGSYLPQRVLTNADLEKMVDTSDEWIFTRTGIRERRIAKEDEYPSTMGVLAAKKALKRASLKPKDIDAIIVSSMTHDYLCPSTAALIQHGLQAEHACAIDIQAACAGYIYGLSIAKAWIESGIYRNILLIATEKNSAFIDFSERSTCVLFGDGAGACLIQNRGKGYQIGHISLGADGFGENGIIIPSSGSRIPTTQESLDQKLHFLKMEGREVFRHAVRQMEKAAYECLEKENLTTQDIAFLVPHQANIRIIDALKKRFHLDDEKVINTIYKYGNTSSSTIPIALEELDTKKKINNDDKLLLVAFGGGYSWGATTLRVKL